MIIIEIVSSESEKVRDKVFIMRRKIGNLINKKKYR
jgi:hypothetical protein